MCVDIPINNQMYMYVQFIFLVFRVTVTTFTKYIPSSKLSMYLSHFQSTISKCITDFLLEIKTYPSLLLVPKVLFFDEYFVSKNDACVKMFHNKIKDLNFTIMMCLIQRLSRRM